FAPPGRSSMTIEAGEQPVRAILIGGEPLGEHLLMWWNFVGRSHEEIVEYREAWMREIGVEEVGAGGDAAVRFGTFPEGEPAPLPAPALPNLRMTPRKR
ncbi:MAG: pirin-like C-terminal cupin domain-containing protein, partial [bacterium]|nr:pirin-like C-terminal cupin domain-containing protein [bacterium]